MGPSAVFGTLVWILAAMGLPRGRWIEVLFLFAPLVLVPIALRAIETPARLRRLRFVQPAAASLAALAFVMPRGEAAAALAVPWLLLTLRLALRGFERLRVHRRDAGEVAIDVGLLALPVGAGWLVLSRLGARPMGFSEPIVLLTAVHFHYAAFVTLAVLGLAGRVLGSRRLYPAIVAGAVTGTPLLAAGITLSRGVEMLGAAVLALSLWAYAGLALVERRTPLLVRLSSFCLLPSMLLAVAYAWGQITGRAVVDLYTVAVVHGTLNALGFGLLGLLAWPPAASPPPSAPVEEGRRQ